MEGLLHWFCLHVVLNAVGEEGRFQGQMCTTVEPSDYEDGSGRIELPELLEAIGYLDDRCRRYLNRAVMKTLLMRCNDQRR